MSDRTVHRVPFKSPIPNWVLWAFATVSWIGVGGLLVGRAAGERRLTWSFMVVASTAYLAMGLLARPQHTRYGTYVALALLCCWVGDLIGPTDFVWGLHAFLAAHLFLIVAFWTTELNWKQSAIAAPVLATVAIGMMLWILPHVPSNERVDVAAYTVVISMMVVAAWGARRNNSWLFPAALIFYVSDVFVARWRYGGGPINGYLCYPLYYTACIFFAVSIRCVSNDDTGRRESCKTDLSP